MNEAVNNLNVKIFADGADKARIVELSQNPIIQGFTTNPTLMRKAGIDDYETFAKEILPWINGRSISFEVFSDDFDDMYRQALRIAEWGSNIYVKIPITNTRGESTEPVLNRLAAKGVQINVTAILTCEQVRRAAACLAGGPPGYISVFAGRVADTGRDPVPLMETCVKMLRPTPNLELIWASPREVLNVFQASDIGCHIITVTPDILSKLTSAGRDLNEFSLETVRMFHRDAMAAGFSL
jgi:transaldolase